MSVTADLGSVLVASPQPPRAWLSALEDLGLRVRACSETAELLEGVRQGGVGLIAVDADLPGLQVQELMAAAGAAGSPPAILFLGAPASGAPSVPREAGDWGILPKPVLAEELQRAVRSFLDSRPAGARHASRRPPRPAREECLGQLVARDPRMRELFALARTAAPTHATILISGESGTGKTLLARAIHRLSPRADRPFVEVSCGALPESLLESELFGHVRGAFTGAVRDAAGRFEQAHLGTLFLDEIGAASPSLQLKLLRFLQDRTFERVGDPTPRTADVRLILASNADLDRAVREGRFRDDLYFRIHVIHLRLPPLRERPADIPPLARHLLRKAAAAHGRSMPRIGRTAARRLLRYTWPGNVRELENALERALLLGTDGELQPEALPVAGGPQLRGERLLRLPELDPSRRYSLKELLREPERQLLLAALEACRGHREKAARLLGINRATLFSKLRRHGLTRRPAARASGQPGGGPETSQRW